ncbi:MAG: flippase-like domain-containing protein, partial [Bacteroidetes bacterium]|nr:flippase-like domain-containing protein [Bacteroidota bacterium]
MSILIYWQIKTRSADFNLIDAFKKGFAWDQFPFLLFAVLFMPVNIFLESLKWKVFVDQFQERFSITSSIKSMLCGSFFGFISPNRVGEFLGRLNRIEKENRSRALTAGYWGGIAQFIITFSIG